MQNSIRDAVKQLFNRGGENNSPLPLSAIKETSIHSINERINVSASALRYLARSVNLQLNKNGSSRSYTYAEDKSVCIYCGNTLKE